MCSELWIARLSEEFHIERCVQGKIAKMATNTGSFAAAISFRPQFGMTYCPPNHAPGSFQVVSQC